MKRQRLHCLRFLLTAFAVFSFAAPAAAESSIPLLRRNAYSSDDDLVTLMQRSSPHTEPVEIREADPFFARIVAQILADMDAIGGPDSGRMRGSLEESLGTYREPS